MYTIHVDGKLLYSPDKNSAEYSVLSPKWTADLNGAGSLSFVLPPCNGCYSAIKKLKSIITLEQDGALVFRGRVMEDTQDFYKQKTIYCEGDRSFLLDSLHKPFKYEGNVQDFFRQLIRNHNNQVDEEKRFSVGSIMAVSDTREMDIESDEYSDTFGRMENYLLNAYGGYIRTRTEGGKTYLDWLKKSGNTTSQKIQFAVNMLDLTDQIDASDVFTCLIPLGETNIDQKTGEYADPVSIKNINGGVEYIQDDAAVEMYGKIWRTHTWQYEKDPWALLEKAKKYLQTGAALRTITLKAIDMHIMDGSIQSIRVGDTVKIYAPQHGMNLSMICSKIDVDLINPENTSYNFGEPPKTLTGNVKKIEEDAGTPVSVNFGEPGGGNGTKKQLEDIIRWAKIITDEANSQIAINAGLIDSTRDYMSAAGINVNGELAQVEVLAKKQTVDQLTGRVSKAESAITVNADNIELKVNKDGVISAINQTAESVVIKASRIDLSGYVTASEFKTEIATLKNTFSNTLSTSNLYAATSFTFQNYGIKRKSIDVVTSVGINKEYDTVQGTDGYGHVVISSVTLSYDTDTIYYLAWY